MTAAAAGGAGVEPTDGDTKAAVVAVVIAAYNAAGFLGLTLESLQAQTEPAWQCTIVDDGSRDDTAEVAERYAADDSRIHLLRQANTGVSGARNAGIEALPPSSFVSFLDADDLLEPDAFARLRAALDDRPELAGAFGIAEYIDEHGAELDLGPTAERHSERQRHRRRIGRLRTVPVPVGADVDFAEVTTHNPMWPPAVILFRRAVVDAVGLFDRRLTQCEDQDYLIRAVRRGPFALLDRRVASYRQHSAQATSDRSDFWFYSDRMRRDSYRSAENTPQQRRIIRRGWRLAQTRRAARCGVRVVQALRARDLAVARDRSLGLVVLVGQLAVNRPPRPSRRHIALTGRGL